MYLHTTQTVCKSTPFNSVYCILTSICIGNVQCVDTSDNTDKDVDMEDESGKSFLSTYMVKHTKCTPLDEPDVIPLLVMGTVDTDLSKMLANEMMMWGLANLWKEGKEGEYSICHGCQPVSDFGHPREFDSTLEESLDFGSPNFFEKAFPSLFPYSHGGIEADQPTPIKFQDHIQWALQYHDHRFHKHETFPFIAFRISQ